MTGGNLLGNHDYRGDYNGDDHHGDDDDDDFDE